MRKFMLLALLMAALVPALPAADDVVFKAMRDELARSMKKLQLENLQKPYFISYRAVETAGCSAQASFGALTSRRQASCAALPTSAALSRSRAMASSQRRIAAHRARPGRPRLVSRRRRTFSRRAIWIVLRRPGEEACVEPRLGEPAPQPCQTLLGEGDVDFLLRARQRHT